MTSDDPARRAAVVYDTVSSGSVPDESGGGGFLISDSMAGGFIHEGLGRKDEDEALREMKVSALPRALEELDVYGSQRAEVQDLLESSAERRNLHEEPVIPRVYFIEAMETVLGGVRRSKRRRTARFENESESDVSNSSSMDADEFQPFEEDGSALLDDEDMDHGKPPASKASTGPRLTKARKEQARFLYRLLLERIPLVAPTMLETYSYKGVRADVTEEEIDKRRIGINELRFAARSLGESPSTTELAEMLYEAEALSAGRTDLHSHQHTHAPRIGLHEYV